jgi:hypothetical protein
MVDNNNDLLARRAAEVEQQGRAGQKEHWESAMRGIEKQINADKMTSADLIQRLAKRDAAGSLFNDGIASASEEDWRKWRDSQPRRRERIERSR